MRSVAGRPSGFSAAFSALSHSQPSIPRRSRSARSCSLQGEACTPGRSPPPPTPRSDASRTASWPCRVSLVHRCCPRRSCSPADLPRRVPPARDASRLHRRVQAPAPSLTGTPGIPGIPGTPGTPGTPGITGFRVLRRAPTLRRQARLRLARARAFRSRSPATRELRVLRLVHTARSSSPTSALTPPRPSRASLPSTDSFPKFTAPPAAPGTPQGSAANSQIVRCAGRFPAEHHERHVRLQPRRDPPRRIHPRHVRVHQHLHRRMVRLLPPPVSIARVERLIHRPHKLVHYARCSPGSHSRGSGGNRHPCSHGTKSCHSTNLAPLVAREDLCLARPPASKSLTGHEPAQTLAC